MKRPTKLQLASWILAGLVALGAIGVYAWRAMAPTDPQTEKARRLWAELREPDSVTRFVRTLVSGQSHVYSEDRSRAIVAELAGLGAAGLPYLRRCLRHKEQGSVRYYAAEELGKMGPAAEEAIPDLIRALTDPSRRVRDKASDALARIGPPAVPALMKALEHPDSTVREHAAWALGQIGPGAAAATTALERAMKDENAFVRDIAAKALKRIQAKGE